MSYRVVTDSRLPYVHSLSGLGAELVAAAPTDPWGVRLAEAFGTPIIGALSQRLAYGQQPAPYTYPYSTGSGVYVQPGGGPPYYGTSYGSFDPRTIALIGGAALLAMMMLRK